MTVDNDRCAGPPFVPHPHKVSVRCQCPNAELSSSKCMVSSSKCSRMSVATRSSRKHADGMIIGDSIGHRLQKHMDFIGSETPCKQNMLLQMRFYEVNWKIFVAMHNDWPGPG